jgi:hypothetical protein
MKDKGYKEMIHSFDLLIHFLISRGLRTLLQCLDNEVSLALRNYLTKQGIDYQLTPHIHHRKNAERAIQNFENISLQGSVQLIPASLSIFGISFYPRQP